MLSRGGKNKVYWPKNLFKKIMVAVASRFKSSPPSPCLLLLLSFLLLLLVVVLASSATTKTTHAYDNPSERAQAPECFVTIPNFPSRTFVLRLVRPKLLGWGGEGQNEPYMKLFLKISAFPAVYDLKGPFNKSAQRSWELIAAFVHAGKPRVGLQDATTPKNDSDQRFHLCPVRLIGLCSLCLTPENLNSMRVEIPIAASPNQQNRLSTENSSFLQSRSPHVDEVL